MISQKVQTNVYTQDGILIPQYSLSKILLIWAAAAIPMGILGWVVAPALVRATQAPLLAREGALIIGLVWQFVLVLILLYQEAGDLRWSTIRQRLFLTTPRSPRMGNPSRRLWWWLVPLILVTATFQVLIDPKIDHLWVSVFPFFATPAGFDLNTTLANPAVRAQMVGAWDVLGINVLLLLFNTFLGEELLFRGVLMPRMERQFGKANWAVNGLMFALYHLHQPWGIPGYILDGVLFFAFPSRLFRSTWFGVVAHSGQAAFFTILILGLVLRWW